MSNRPNSRLAPSTIGSVSFVLVAESTPVSSRCSEPSAYLTGRAETVSFHWSRNSGQTVETWESNPAGALALAEIVRCPACGGELVPTDSFTWVCLDCEKRASVGDDGVLELLRMK